MFALKVKIVKFSCTISSISSHCIARCIRVMPSSHFSTPCLHLITSDQTEIWSHLLTFDHICSNGDLLTFAYIWSKIETCFHQDLLMTIMIWNKNTVITYHPCSNGEQSFRQEHFLVTIMTLEWKCITFLPTFAETDKCLQGEKVDVQQNSLMPFSWKWVGKISHQPFFTFGHICWNREASWQIVCGEKSWQLATKFTMAVVKITLQTFYNSHCKKVWPKQIIIHN